MVRLIAELGINHQSNLDIAKKLIDHAYDSNCWAIKFQYRNLKNFYNDVNEIGDELIYDQLSETNLSLKQISTLRDYAVSKGLRTGISFFTLDNFIEIKNSKILFDFYKIPSAEFSNFTLINEVAKDKKMIIASTGGHDLKQIKKNIKKINKINDLVLLHCTSNYPTELGDQNISVIPELKKIPNIKVGYSSHDIDYEVVFLALALGAEYIERHITIDKRGKGLDDSSSSDINEFKSIGNIINKYEKILGNKNKPINQGEILNLQNLGTSAYSDKTLEVGDYVDLKQIKIKAPRKGLTYDELESFIDKPLVEKLEKNKPITFSHFSKTIKMDNEDFNFMDKQGISIPIRFHDMEKVFEQFEITNFEFHLSYKEVKNFESKNFELFNEQNDGKKFSFHLPDYINNYQLFDPLSSDKNIKNDSMNIIKKVFEISKHTSSKSKIFISSLSQNNYKDKNTYYSNLKKFINSLKERYNIEYLPQWLPKKAWYFGGYYEINLFSSLEDIEHIAKNEINICLDTAHLIMSANSSDADWRSWYKMLEPFTKHIHLSDSYGENGEGVAFGDGDLGNPKKIINKKNTAKVLEVWQGHMNDLYGFKKAVKDLRNYY